MPIEVAGVRLLTDPMLRGRVVHLRRSGPPVAAPHPPPEAVLISHMHRDHLDVPSLRRLGRVPVIVPRGAGADHRPAGLVDDRRLWRATRWPARMVGPRSGLILAVAARDASPSLDDARAWAAV